MFIETGRVMLIETRQVIATEHMRLIERNTKSWAEDQRKDDRVHEVQWR